MHRELRHQAIQLRKKGFSYSEILSKIPVAKSTLSGWLHSIKLADYQAQRLTAKKIWAQKRGAESRRTERLAKTSRIEDQAVHEVPSLIKDPFWLLGVVLYWAEGSKEKEWNPSVNAAFTNTDPAMVTLFVQWVKKYLGITVENMDFSVFIHERGNIKRALHFWATTVLVPSKKIKLYLKKHNPKPNRHNTNEKYLGTLKIRIKKSTDINRKIAGWIKGVIQCINNGE